MGTPFNPIVPLLGILGPLVKDPSLDHVGIQVMDLDRAIHYYSSNFGWDNLSIHEVEMKGCKFKGKTGNCRLRATTARPGPTLIELFEAVDGDSETPYIEFRDTRGEGLHHIGFKIDNLDHALGQLATKGIQPYFYHHFLDRGVAFAYLRIPEQAGGILFELIERKK